MSFEDSTLSRYTHTEQNEKECKEEVVKKTNETKNDELNESGKSWFRKFNVQVFFGESGA